MKKNLANYLKDFFLSVMSILFVIILIATVLVPKFTELTDLNKQIKAQQELSKKLNEKISDLKSLSEGELSNSVSLLSSALPAEKEVFSFLNSIKSSISQGEMSLEDYVFEPGDISTFSAELKAKKSFNTISIKLKINGDYKQIYKYIEDTEKRIPILNINSFSISQTSTSSGSYSSDIQMEGYYQPLPKEIGSISSPLPKIENQKKQIVEELLKYNKIVPTDQGSISVQVGKDNLF